MRTLIEDFKGLFKDNENIKNILSNKGISNIGSLSNWYEYASIWFLLIFTVVYVLSLLHLRKLDIEYVKNSI